jgi:hypothetical protein
VLYSRALPLAGKVLFPSVVWITVANALVLELWRLNGKEPLYPVVKQSAAASDRSGSVVSGGSGAVPRRGVADLTDAELKGRKVSCCTHSFIHHSLVIHAGYRGCSVFVSVLYCPHCAECSVVPCKQQQCSIEQSVFVQCFVVLAFCPQ